MEYWAKRMAQAQNNLTTKNIKQVEKQSAKYYKTTLKQLAKDFEATYDKLLTTIEADKQPTPSDLYKLDKYWELQGQINKELKKMGEKEIELFSNAFQFQFKDIYNSIAFDNKEAFITLQAENIPQMINQIWCADGKVWSDRIWSNTEKLAETLNKELISCVVSGKKTSQLKEVLQKRFDVSYHSANTIARTEMAHIQTQAARERYREYGIKEFEILVDSTTCDECNELAEKHYSINDYIPIPCHPNCRCCIVPIVD